MKRTVTGTVLALALVSSAIASPAMAKSPTRAAVEGCIATGVATSATVWITAILASPWTGGFSLFVPLFSDKVVIAGTIGCVTGAAGSAEAATLPDS